MNGGGRPKTAGDRAEDEMKVKAKRMAAAATDPIEKLRWHALARGNKGILGLGRMFRVMDDDGNRSLSLEEFADGVTKTGLEMDADEIKVMFDMLDEDKSGSVNISEFLEKVRVSDRSSNLPIKLIPNI